MSFEYLDDLFSSISPLEVLKKKSNKEEKSVFSSKAKKEKSLTKIKAENPLKNAYETLKGTLQRGQGLNQITSLVSDSSKGIKKLKGKFFMLRKNEIKRGKKNKKTKNGIASRKLKRKKNLHNLKEIKDFSLALKINEFWNDYIKELLDLENKEKLHDSDFLNFLKGDFHGAFIKVKKSKIESNDGIEGIVMKETLKTFGILNKLGEYKLVIKENCLFEVKVGNRKFEFLGISMVYRSDERTRVKYKKRNFLGRIERIVDIKDC